MVGSISFTQIHDLSAVSRAQLRVAQRVNNRWNEPLHPDGGERKNERDGSFAWRCQRENNGEEHLCFVTQTRNGKPAQRHTKSTRTHFSSTRFPLQLYPTTTHIQERKEPLPTIKQVSTTHQTHLSKKKNSRRSSHHLFYQHESQRPKLQHLSGK